MKLSNLIQFQNKPLTIDSREVAKMVGKDHSHLLRDIKGYIEILGKSNFGLADFFVENTYTDLQGKKRNCYKVTKKGCEMIAHKLTGEKGVLFTATYIERFHDMEAQIQKPTCIEDVLIQSLQEMKDMRLQIEEAKKQTSEVKEEVQDIRNVITLNPQAAWRRECNRILNAIGRELGDFKTPKDQVYEALKTRGKCRPNVLVLNLRKRAMANGMAPSRVEKLNILDVLENEPRLKEIYISIVKEMAIKNGVRIREEAAI
jgi:Rha family phage regulatory protein